MLYQGLVKLLSTETLTIERTTETFTCIPCLWVEEYNTHKASLAGYCPERAGLQQPDSLDAVCSSLKIITLWSVDFVIRNHLLCFSFLMYRSSCLKPLLCTLERTPLFHAFTMSCTKLNAQICPNANSEPFKFHVPVQAAGIRSTS